VTAAADNEEYGTHPNGDLFWRGWRALRVGDRVHSIHPRNGMTLMRGSITKIPRDKRGRVDTHAVHHGGLTVLWDTGVEGKVVNPGDGLRPGE
jgi:hypothetical protein